MKYTLLIQRDDGYMPETIVSREVDANYVINLLVATPVDADATEPMIEGYNTAPAKRIPDVKLPDDFGQMADKSPEPKPQKAPRKVNYDREAVEAAILAGGKTKHIAEDHGISQVTVNTIKKKLKASGELLENPKATELEWYFTDVLDMVRDGLSDEEIYKNVYTRITNAQYRDALVWAKANI